MTGFREDDPHGATAAGGSSVTGQLNSYKFDVIAVTTVNVRAETEEQARAMIDGLNSITTRTTGDDIEAVHGLDVSTRDYDVANVSPRGRGHLVSAESPGGEEISISEFEEFAEPIMVDDLAGLREELAKADRFLAGDDYADAHEALHDMAETVRGLLAGSSPWRPGKSSLAVSTPDATGAPTRPAIAAPRGQGSPGEFFNPVEKNFGPHEAEDWPRDLTRAELAGLMPQLRETIQDLSHAIKLILDRDILDENHANPGKAELAAEGARLVEQGAEAIRAGETLFGAPGGQPAGLAPQELAAQNFPRGPAAGQQLSSGAGDSSRSTDGASRRRPGQGRQASPAQQDRPRRHR